MSDYKEPRISRTIRSDFSQTKIKEEFKAEYKDLKQYFLTEERKKKLEGMHVVKKFFILPWWLLKALYISINSIQKITFAFPGIIFILITREIPALNDENFNG